MGCVITCHLVVWMNLPPGYQVHTFSLFRGLNFNHAKKELNKEEVSFEILNILNIWFAVSLQTKHE